MENYDLGYHDETKESEIKYELIALQYKTQLYQTILIASGALLGILIGLQPDKFPSRESRCLYLSCCLLLTLCILLSCTVLFALLRDPVLLGVLSRNSETTLHHEKAKKNMARRRDTRLVLVAVLFLCAIVAFLLLALFLSLLFNYKADEIIRLTPKLPIYIGGVIFLSLFLIYVVLFWLIVGTRFATWVRKHLRTKFRL